MYEDRKHDIFLGLFYLSERTIKKLSKKHSIKYHVFRDDVNYRFLFEIEPDKCKSFLETFLVLERDIRRFCNTHPVVYRAELDSLNQTFKIKLINNLKEGG